MGEICLTFPTISEDKVDREDIEQSEQVFEDRFNWYQDNFVGSVDVDGEQVVKSAALGATLGAGYSAVTGGGVPAGIVGGAITGAASALVPESLGGGGAVEYNPPNHDWDDYKDQFVQ